MRRRSPRPNAWRRGNRRSRRGISPRGPAGNPPTRQRIRCRRTGYGTCHHACRGCRRRSRCRGRTPSAGTAPRPAAYRCAGRASRRDPACRGWSPWRYRACADRESRGRQTARAHPPPTACAAEAARRAGSAASGSEDRRAWLMPPRTVRRHPCRRRRTSSPRQTSRRAACPRSARGRSFARRTCRRDGRSRSHRR